VPQQAATAQARIWRRVGDHYLFGSGGLFGNIAMWEQMILLRGYENVMLDMATRDRRLYRLRDALLDRALETLKWDVQTDADGIGFADDWGMQKGLMIRPDLWREFFRPVYKALFQVVRAAGKHVHFHTDGDTTEILGDLVDVGASVLNVQHSVMDIGQIGRDFGGQVAFRSDIDCQHVLNRGTRQEVFDHVRQVFECLGSYDGGLIWHGEIEPDRPLQNVRWMLEAFREIGVYA
jgi:uroporphyrinogen-III decarboxylase